MILFKHLRKQFPMTYRWRAYTKMSENDSNGRILLADYPKLPLEGTRIAEMVADAHDFAHAHGLVIRTAEQKDKSDICQSAPFALLPSPFPKNVFEKAVNVQNLIAGLYHDIAYDYDFLVKIHENVVKTDDFTRNMINIYTKVKEQGMAQPVTLAIQRSDYMCHKDPFSAEYSLKQIEVNNIASSMGAHAERLTALHRRTLLSFGYDKEFVDRCIPKNEPIKLIAEAVYKGWAHANCPNAIVLVVIEPVNQNQIDQRHVEYELERMGIPSDQILRRTLAQCHENLKLDDEKHLYYSGSRVAIVYFRAGYSPDHYPTEKEWDARLTMELSTAIKSPWIGLQIANTKKTQQVLAEDGVVERFIGSPRDANSIRTTFAGLWPIDKDDAMTKKIVDGAISHTDNFVLKPQLEGGAGNFYGQTMAKMLKELKGDDRGAYILMEKLKPIVVENYLVRSNYPTQLSKAVSELGIFGYSFGTRDDPELKTGGHLLRTKGETVNEGGVAVGNAVIDTPFLYEFI